MTSLKTGQIGHLSKTSKNEGPTNLTVVADEKSPSSLLRFLLWTGQPLHQPIVAYGPFVMNSKEQIDEVFYGLSKWCFWLNSRCQIVTGIRGLVHKLSTKDDFSDIKMILKSFL